MGGSFCPVWASQKRIAFCLPTPADAIRRPSGPNAAAHTGSGCSAVWKTIAPVRASKARTSLPPPTATSLPSGLNATAMNGQTALARARDRALPDFRSYRLSSPWVRPRST